MDPGTILTAIILASAAAGSWFQGRKAGTANAITTASDVVGMLATQVGELRAQITVKDAQIEQLRITIASLEGHQQAGERTREGDPEGSTDDPPGA